MRKLIAAVALVLCVLAAALAAAVVLLDGERLRVLAIERLERNGAAEVEIERVTRTIGLTPRIEITGITIHDPQFADTPLLALERAAFDVDLPSLVFRPVELRDIVLERPSIVVPVDDDGVLYWGRALGNQLRQLRQLDWGFHDFRVRDLRLRARHAARDAELLTTIASIEGTMPSPADLTVHIRDIGGNLQARLPVPTTGNVHIAQLRLFHVAGPLPVRLEIDGSVGSRTLAVRARGGNPLEGDADARDELDVDLSLGDSRLRVDGSVSRSAAPHLDVEVEADVERMAAVPSARARFGLADRDGIWNIENIVVASGDARASGALRVERREGKPLLAGSLTASGLALGSAGNGNNDGENASRGRDESAEPGDSATGNGEGSRAGNEPAPAFEPLEALRSIDAMLALEANDLTVRGFALPRASAVLDWSDGRLEVAPIEARPLDGTATARFILWTAESPRRIDAEAMFRGIELTDTADRLGIDANAFGTVEGSLDLQSTGSATGEALAAASGRFTAVMSDGRLSAALAELADMDLAGAVLGAFDGDDTTPIRCAIADFEGRNGVFETRALILDTGTVKLVGAGTIDLDARTIDLVVRSHAKDFSLLSADAPIHVTGSLSDPDVSTDTGEAAASLLTPIQLGDAESAPCRRLIEEARRAVGSGSAAP